MQNRPVAVLSEAVILSDFVRWAVPGIEEKTYSKQNQMVQEVVLATQ